MKIITALTAKRARLYDCPAFAKNESRDSHTEQKATRGHYQTWFFCTHQKHSFLLFWWGVLSSPLKGWPGLAGSANLIHPTAQRFAPMGGGLSLLQGITAMTSHTPTTGNPAKIQPGRAKSTLPTHPCSIWLRARHKATVRYLPRFNFRSRPSACLAEIPSALVKFSSNARF